MVISTIMDCRNSPNSGPISIPIKVSSIASRVEASTAVPAEIMPELAFTTF